MDGIPRLPGVTHAIDFSPAFAIHNEQLRIPRMPVNGSGNARIDLMHQCIEAARRAAAVRPHVDPSAQTTRGGLERYVLPTNHRLPMAAPFVEELGAALFLHRIVSDRGRGPGLGRHRVVPPDPFARRGREWISCAEPWHRTSLLPGRRGICSPCSFLRNVVPCW